jgi:hypothetical protein
VGSTPTTGTIEIKNGLAVLNNVGYSVYKLTVNLRNCDSEMRNFPKDLRGNQWNLSFFLRISKSFLSVKLHV